MQVSEIWRYPVKSMQGERLEAVDVGPHGIVGDRAWALFDAESGLHLTARRDPELLFATARLADDSGSEVVIALPDGTEANDDKTLSTWLGRPVELRRAEVETVPSFEIQLDETDADSWFQWSGDGGSFHDSGTRQISLVSVQAFRTWEPRRFRTNVIVDSPGEIELVGQQITIGSARFDVTKQIDRCVMVTRPQPAHGDQPAIERDLEVLKTINAELDTFLSVGAVVVDPGPMAVGDAVIATD
jgi:uncharacterized protein YcbX